MFQNENLLLNYCFKDIHEVSVITYHYIDYISTHIMYIDSS